MAFTDGVVKGHKGLLYEGTIGSDTQVGHVTEWSIGGSRPKIRTTAMGDTVEAYELGLPDPVFSAKGYFNPADDGQTALKAAYDAAAGTAVTTTLYFQGTASTSGDHFTGDVKIDTYNFSAGQDGLIAFDLSGTGSLALTAAV